MEKRDLDDQWNNEDLGSKLKRAYEPLAPSYKKGDGINTWDKSYLNPNRLGKSAVSISSWWPILILLSRYSPGSMVRRIFWLGISFIGTGPYRFGSIWFKLVNCGFNINRCIILFLLRSVDLRLKFSSVHIKIVEQ